MNQPIKIIRNTCVKLDTPQQKARDEAIYRFLETVLLPKVEEKDSITSDELFDLATNFKTKYAEENKDFDMEYELLTQVELVLILVSPRYNQMRNKRDPQKRAMRLIRRTLELIKPILDNEFERFSTI